MTTRPLPASAFAHRLASSLACALWVAICTASPEVIWRGMRLAVHHVGTADIGAAILIGLILAFFVEPLLERLRGLAHGSPHHPTRPVLFTAATGLAFALAAVSLHEAMTSLLSPRTDGHGHAASGLAAALELTLAFSLVPFSTMLAWLNADRRWLASAFGVLAACSAGLAGMMFGWTAEDVVTTTIPCLAILWLGLRRALPATGALSVERFTRPVVQVAAVWLGFALVLDTALDALHLKSLSLYSPAGFWIDVRFYGGWILGLMLVPAPAGLAAEDGGPGGVRTHGHSIKSRMLYR